MGLVMELFYQFEQYILKAGRVGEAAIFSFAHGWSPIVATWQAYSTNNG
jgi:hypothetical protein